MSSSVDARLEELTGRLSDMEALLEQAASLWARRPGWKWSERLAGLAATLGCGRFCVGGRRSGDQSDELAPEDDIAAVPPANQLQTADLTQVGGVVTGQEFGSP